MTLYFIMTEPPGDLVKNPTRQQGLENVKKQAAHNTAFADRLKEFTAKEKIDGEVAYVMPSPLFIRIECTQAAMDKIKTFPGIRSVMKDQAVPVNKGRPPRP